MLRSERRFASASSLLDATAPDIRFAAGPRGRDAAGLAARGLFLLCALLMGALIYLALNWPSAERLHIASAIPAVQPPVAAAPAPKAAELAVTAPVNNMAAGTLITQGARGVNAAAQTALLAQQAARTAAAAAPVRVAAASPAPVAAASPAPAARTASSAPTGSTSVAAAPAPSAAPSAANTIATTHTAPADAGPSPAQRSSGPLPNRIIVPATVPPSVPPH